MAFFREGNVYWPVVDSSSEKYRREQQEGYRRITEWRNAVVQAEKERSLRLYEKAEGPMAAVVASPGAVRILGAWGLRVHRPQWDSWPVILNKDELHARARDIPVFVTTRKQR